MRLLLLLVLTGCVPKTYVIETTHQMTPENAHYIIVSGGKVWDCMSMPDGSTWAPMCQEVAFESDKVGIRRDSPEYEGRTAPASE